MDPETGRWAAGLWRRGCRRRTSSAPGASTREQLGLEPVDERPGGLLYRCGGCEFALFQSVGAASGEHTQMGWEVDDVDDVDAAVAELRARGVVFEEVDVPGLRTVDGIAEVEGNYPSKGGVGERAAWFKDSEGNLIGMGQRLGR